MYPMTAQEYLEHRLQTCSQYSLTEYEKQLASENLKDFLFTQLTRKKFRRWKLSDIARERLIGVLEYCIPKKLPLLVRFRFGGYKLWRMPTTPGVDWAKFFAIAHYAAYLAPVLAAYEPGVKLLFMSDDVFVEPMDNVSKSSTESYYQSFLTLLQEFKKYTQKNFDIEIIRHSSLYASEEALQKELDEKIQEIEPIWKEKMTPEKLKTSLAISALNIKWDGVKDLTGLTEAEKEKFVERGVLFHEALVKVPTIRAFSDNNPAMFSISCGLIPSVVSIGTTKSSVAKFWAGIGVLEERDGMYYDLYYDRVLSPSQFVRMQEVEKQDVPIQLIPLNNFLHVSIYKEGFNYA